MYLHWTQSRRSVSAMRRSPRTRRIVGNRRGDTDGFVLYFVGMEMDRVTRRNLRKKIADYVKDRKGRNAKADAAKEFGVSLAFVSKAVKVNK